MFQFPTQRGFEKNIIFVYRLMYGNFHYKMYYVYPNSYCKDRTALKSADETAGFKKPLEKHFKVYFNMYRGRQQQETTYKRKKMLYDCLYSTVHALRGKQSSVNVKRFELIQTEEAYEKQVKIKITVNKVCLGGNRRNVVRIAVIVSLAGKSFFAKWYSKLPVIVLRGLPGLQKSFEILMLQTGEGQHIPIKLRETSLASSVN